MKKVGAMAAALLVSVAVASLGARVGQPGAPFTASDTKGRQHKLSDYQGKFVVLEWHNQGCPFVAKHYNSGNMQRLQREWTAKGVVWFTVISSAPGKQGYVTAAQEDAYVSEKKANPSAVLLDPAGDVGRAYGARTTPHMFVIDPKGVLVYNGAIDDKPTTDTADVAGALDYVSTALREAMLGKAVTTPATQPYGCSVKYAEATH
ncbi:MAG: redoxin domain-containing protein [Acidobacteria bacterium]|nr:redoxin domain-containing protein [Acidobacteriota bacterium]